MPAWVRETGEQTRGDVRNGGEKGKEIKKIRHRGLKGYAKLAFEYKCLFPTLCPFLNIHKH